MQRTTVHLSWVRGGTHPGAKHQKHVSLVPTQYLYRFPQNPSLPGPNVMKYYWTLGCFPTGLQSPFRLWEFLAEYRSGHIPEEVEEFLRRHIQDPVESVDEAVRALMAGMGQLPNAVAGAAYTAQLPMVSAALPQLKAVEKELGIEVPAVCLRGVAGDRHLKARALDDLYDYSSSLREGGSTPHRRAMRSLMEKASIQSGGAAEELFLPDLAYYQQLPAGPSSEHAAAATLSAGGAEGEKESGASSASTSASSPSSDASPPALRPSHGTIAAALNVEKNTTAPDERALIRLLTTFGEGAMRAKRYDAAATVLESALLFANDDDTRSTVHNNLATACNRSGEFKTAEHNAREAVLLNHSKKAFANLGVALAYQHREDEALSVLSDAAAIYAGDAEIAETQKQVLAFAAGRPTPKSLSAATVGGASTRYYSNTSRQRAIANGVGNNFGNQFDEVAFNEKKINATLNPSEFTQWFARAHISGLNYRTSTASFERN